MAKTGTDQPKRPTHPWLQGMVQAVPIVLGYIPVGFAYGVPGAEGGPLTF